MMNIQNFMYFHNCITQLFAHIDYKYISAFYNNITKTINMKNQEKNEKNIFFRLLCDVVHFFTKLFLSKKKSIL